MNIRLYWKFKIYKEKDRGGVQRAFPINPRTSYVCQVSLTQFQSHWQIKYYTVDCFVAQSRSVINKCLITTYFINIDIFKRDYACTMDLEALFSHCSVICFQIAVHVTYSFLCSVSKDTLRTRCKIGICGKFHMGR